MNAALLELRPESIGRERVLSFRSFSDLAALPPEPDWLWEGLLAQGAVTMLAGHPYVGKTMLVSSLLRAMESGSEFLGRETQQATAVIVTEEHEATLRPRAELLQLLELRSEFIGRGDGILRVEWPTLIEQATEHALKRGHELLVIDTFTGLAGLGPEEENDAGAITARLRPLQAAAGAGLAVLFLHHLNKYGQPRGSSAFRGLTDTAIRIRREQGRKDFRLQIESRFSTPGLLRGRLIATPEGLSYVVVGDRNEPREAEAPTSTDDQLLEALRNAGRQGLTYDEIDEIPGLSVDKAKRRLPIWFDNEKIQREGSGRKGNPYRWFALPA